MAERKILFSLDWDRFQAILSSLSSTYPNAFILQNEFKTHGILLSQSLLIWNPESDRTWLLADFENEKSYNIEQVNDTAGNQRVDISELSDEAEQPITLTNAEVILAHLQTAQGTDRGFLYLLQRLNLDELDLERLKRSDLSGAGFSFEFVNIDLVNVYNMLREILTTPHEWTLNVQQGITRNIVRNLQEFYEKSQVIMDFVISGENPRETHDSRLQEISQFCNSAKESLGHIITYLSSRKVEQLAATVDDTVTAAVDRLETETNRAEEINNETEKRIAEKERDLDQLTLKIQNQLTEKPISKYKTIFADQAKKHRDGAWFWLAMAGVGIGAFFLAFYKLPISLESGGSQSTQILQNFFAKVFLLSPIYLWLNRSIKNYTAQKHLEVINTHRQNALETFDTFVAAAEGNRETRDAVLLSATEAIFDANQTGYLSTKSIGSDSRSPMQQIIKEIIPEKSSSKN